MLRRLLNRLKFELERFVVRSPLHRLLFIALLIGMVSVSGGVLARRTAPFGTTADAIWWAFLRLTDPGYLGDDQGAVLRFISTILTVLGYVIFLGALIAIMTQWLNATMQRLESGLTPIAANHHVLILGYSSRTSAIIEELLVSEARVQRFLDARGAARLKIVILAERVDVQTVQDLKDRLGPLWRPRQIVFRTGTPLRIEHLHRVDFLHASAILLPSYDHPGDKATSPDARTIKALRATSASSRALNATRLPLVVAEILDERRVDIAERAYGGPIEILATDAFVARLVMQTLRHPGISMVYEELLAPARDDEIYVRHLPQLAGKKFSVAGGHFTEAIPLGVIRRREGRFEAILAPPPQFVLREDDQLVFVAKSFDACTPAASLVDAGFRSERASVTVLDRTHRPRRVLVLGWNHKIPALVREFGLEPCEGGVHEVDIFSSKSIAAREAALGAEPVPRVRVRNLEGDYASPGDIARLSPASYDNVILVASDRVASPHESDARTILGHLILEGALAAAERRPAVVVELMGTENVALLGEHDSEVIVSPVILSHILTQVALRRELHAVYTDLFDAGGAELVLRSPSDYGVDGRATTFAEVRTAAGRGGEIAFGLLVHGTLELVPARTTPYELRAGDRIVAITRVDEPRRSSVPSVRARGEAPIELASGVGALPD